MSCSVPRYLLLASGLFGMLSGSTALLPIAQAASPPAATPTVPTGKHSVVFDFAGLDASGDIRVGNALKLSLTLYGAVQSHAPLIAICESIHFERQIVTMEPDSRSMEMHATAILEPIAPGKLSVSPKVVRIQVTFARAQADKKLERVMKRIVYVTLGTSAPQHNHADLPPPRLYEPGEEDTGNDDILPEATLIADNSLAEENLLPLPAPGPGPTYWQHVSALLNQSWGRTVHQVRHAPSSETVHVRFRIYPNGRAQLIQIEKGSGAREINEAGIDAVVDAQPFPPFPGHVGSGPIDVHVRMRTGVRPGSHDMRPASVSTAR